MKKTIHPPIEIDVDKVGGKYCTKKCPQIKAYKSWMMGGSGDQHDYYCRKFGNMEIPLKRAFPDNSIVRCQACLDAEKESKSINLKEKQHEV